MRNNSPPGSQAVDVRAAYQRIWSNPGALVVLFAGMQVVAWTLAPALTYSAPPLDVVEGYMWGREWVIATYKHPALPSWFLEASRVVTGSVGWPAYLLSQLFVTATFASVFLLGRDMMGPERAAAGTLLLAGVAYYAWPSPEFNHNVAAAPFWAALALALWRAVERRSLLWWALVGVFAAGGLYAKLSTALLLATVAAWMLFDRSNRAQIATPGPWFALVAFALLTAPLLNWLVANDFAPLRYAAERSAVLPIANIPKFLFDIIANLTGMLVMLAIAGLVGPWRRPADTVPLQQACPPVSEQALRFLLFLTMGPLALAIVGALLSQSGLKTAWGSSMFDLVGLLAVAMTAERYASVALRRIALSAAVLLIVLPIGHAAIVKIDAFRPFNAGMRANWNQRAIADRFEAVWFRETGQRLGIVGGDNWIASLVGLTHKDRPSIFTNGSMTLSPWITQRRLEREGLLVVWDARTKRIPTSFLPLIAAAKSGEEHFGLGARESGLVIGYTIVPPKRP